MNFEDILFNTTPEIAEIARSFRKMILAVDPSLEEGIYGGKKVRMSLYHIDRPNNPAVGIAAAATHCQVFIHHFDMVNTEGLKLHGKGKHARHFKFFNKEEIDQTRMEQLFQEIVEIVKKR